MPSRRLKAETADFRLLFAENPLAMWVLDRETRKVLEANRAADELRREWNADLAELTASAGKGARRLRGAGGTIDGEVMTRAVQWAGRDATLVTFVDVKGRSHLEEQLRQAQKMESVGMLAGGVAHDFNNLLTIINGYSQLVLNGMKAGDPHRQSVEQVIKAGDRAAALTQQLLAFSRRQAVEPKVIDLNKLVAGLSTMLRRLIGEDIELRLEPGQGLGRVNADPGQIEQVLMNLAVNARDAMPKGGAITLETANALLDGKHVVLLRVTDSGEGMDAETQARLFEPFFTTKASGKGTGLGLATVLGIVKQSSGRVKVRSEVGKGTTVEVYLPRVDVAIKREQRGASRRVRRGTETLLVVEDDDMVRHLMRKTLEQAGYTVVDTPEAGEAHRIAAAHAGTIDLLITDVILPKVSGTELAAQLEALHRGLKVLYISGHTEQAVANSGLMHQDVVFLQKPFTPVQLVAKVREALGNNDTRRGAGK